MDDPISVRRKLAEEGFFVPGGEYVKWDDATLADHLQTLTWGRTPVLDKNNPHVLAAKSLASRSEAVAGLPPRLKRLLDSLPD